MAMNNRLTFTEIQTGIDFIFGEIESISKEIELLSLSDGKTKGACCSRCGSTYEYYIWSIVSRCFYKSSGMYLCSNDKLKIKLMLGGSSNNNDLIIVDEQQNKIPIEIKTTFSAPDWGQCVVKHINGRWQISPKSKHSQKFKNIINNILRDQNTMIFNGKVPKFCSQSITHSEWLDIKSSTRDYDDFYIACDNNIINQYYIAKRCKYIQIDGKGLYKLSEEDPCKFNVPLFKCEQRIRIRVKVHRRKLSSGYASLSVTAATQPCGNIEKSIYSLSDIDELPQNIKLDK